MTKTCLISLCFLAMNTLNAANEPVQKVASAIKEVTVYLSGAKLNSEASVSLKMGNNDIIFENLPTDFNPTSLQVRLKGTAELLSAKFQRRYPEAPKENPKALIIRDSMVILGDFLSEIANERAVLTGEESLIATSQNKVGTAQSTQISMTVAELSNLAAYYQSRMLAIKKRGQELVILERNTRLKLTQLQVKLSELAPNQGKQSGEITMRIYAPTAQTIDINCLYFARNAAWRPMYDLRSEGIDKPLTLVYKAGIQQNTGIDWSNVKLHLSTVNPNFDNSRPIMSAQYVDFYVQKLYDEMPNADNQDLDPMRSNFFQLKQLDSSGKPIKSEKLKTEELDFKDTQKNDIRENGNILNLAFDVPINQTIPTGGEEYIIKVEENALKNVVYEYHSVPKLDPSVFLMAKVTDYGQYNLMPAYASIFFEDTYIGQSFIDPKTVADTLALSLGRDENIAIKRAKPIDIKSEKKIIGNTKKEVITYEITIKNNKRVAISIEIFDQIPISRQKDIEIDVDKNELSGADYNKDFGKLSWRIKIEPNTSKRLRFGYSIKYPKDKVVTTL
jgi:uncharacterized protein (TIGR02231 family)